METSGFQPATGGFAPGPSPLPESDGTPTADAGWTAGTGHLPADAVGSAASPYLPSTPAFLTPGVGAGPGTGVEAPPVGAAVQAPAPAWVPQPATAPEAAHAPAPATEAAYQPAPVAYLPEPGQTFLPEPGQTFLPEPVPTYLPQPGAPVVPVALEPMAVEPEPEPVAVEPEPVAVEPEPVAVEPEPVAVEPEPAPVAFAPEPVAVEPEPASVAVAPVGFEPEPVAVEPEPVVLAAPVPALEPVATEAPVPALEPVPVLDTVPAPALEADPAPVPVLAAVPALEEPVPAPVPVRLVEEPVAPAPAPGLQADDPVLVAAAEADESSYHRATTESGVDENDFILNDLLIMVLETGASDLHLTTGARPTLRIHGELQPVDDYPVLTPPVIQRVMYAALTQKQREKFEENLELDFAYSVPGRARFRVNIYRQRDALGAAFRLIPFEIKKLADLGVPPAVANFASLPRGFVLVTGPTGSGKSTTLAGLVDLANRTRRDHIMTVEDPIEFLHRHQSCIVNQREVGEDTWSFGNALKHVLRQDPDIILVGEMRDLETIGVALTAAETGHLVFATLHTQDAAQTIDRVIDVFPTHQQQQVRVQLAGTIQGIVCQTLCKTRDGRGRVVATEVLVATPAIRNLIREGKTHQIYSAMQAGAKHGMHTLDQHLADLVNKGVITYEHGVEKCHHIEDFNRLTGRA